VARLPALSNSQSTFLERDHLEPSNSPIRRRKLRALEWPTIRLLIVCYGLWFIIGFYVYPALPVLALAIYPIVISLHLSLQHEALHGHPTRKRWINEMLVGLPLGVFYPYRRYKDMHLRHHADERLTDPYDDPESFYRALYDWERMPRSLKTLLRWNNTFIGRVTLGPALAFPAFLMNEAKQLRTNKKIRKAWALHAAGLTVLALLLEGVLGIPFWLYALTSAYGGLSILAIRSYCEHQWSDRPDGRTIIVENSVLSMLFLNNNLHLVHHKHPTSAWYELPRLYAERRDEWLAMNGGYVFMNYFEIFRAFAFQAKEPVVHPGLRRGISRIALTPQQNFGMGTKMGMSVPLPAKPPTE
jgi:fatty acid desaturase